MGAGEIGQHGRHGAAADGFFHGPEQLGDRLDPAQHDGIGIEAKTVEAGGVGEAELLAVARQLQIEQRRPVAGKQGPRQPEPEAERGAGEALVSGEDLMQQAMGTGDDIERARFVNGHGRSRGRQIGRLKAPFEPGDAGPQILQLLFSARVHSLRSKRTNREH